MAHCVKPSHSDQAWISICGFSSHVPVTASALVLLHRSLRWRHNELDGVSNHQHYHCLLNYLFGCRSKKTSKLRVTGLCVGNSPGTGEFPAQKASNAENVSIWWRHHDGVMLSICGFKPKTLCLRFYSRRCWCCFELLHLFIMSVCSALMFVHRNIELIIVKSLQRNH